jgi:putative NADH-flavin reductase
VRGDVLDADFVARVVPSHDAVTSGLGMRYRHPWARRESPDDFTSAATRHIIAAMQQAGVDRISLISAAGVGGSRARANVFLKLMIATSNVGHAYADLERVERTLRDSGLDWQAVRPTTLSHRRGTGRVRITNRYRATNSIAREDVATFILREIEADRFSVRTPIITAG